MQCEVRLTICRYRLVREWVGYHPSHNVGGRRRLGYHRRVGARVLLVGDGAPSSVWLGLYCPRWSGGGSSKAIAALSLGGIVVVFGMVV